MKKKNRNKIEIQDVNFAHLWFVNSFNGKDAKLQ